MVLRLTTHTYKVVAGKALKHVQNTVSPGGRHRQRSRTHRVQFNSIGHAKYSLKYQAINRHIVWWFCSGNDSGVIIIVSRFCILLLGGENFDFCNHYKSNSCFFWYWFLCITVYAWIEGFKGTGYLYKKESR